MLKLYPHQEEALSLTKDYTRCAYYYDMGLGKTFIGSEKMHQLNSRINLVICQKSKINDWVEHFMKYYSTKFLIFDLTNKTDFDAFMSYQQQDQPYERIGVINYDLDAFMSYQQQDQPYERIGVINYDLVWRRPELLQLHDFTLMLDESSLITNPKANRSKFILKLNPANVILLSGTPTAGKYEKLWSQLKLLGWNISEDAFWGSYVNYEWQDYGGFWEKHVYGYKNVDHLKRKLAEHGAIFKKTSEVMDLPKQIDQIIYIEPSKAYKTFEKHHYVEIDGKELIGDTALTRILYQRQLCGQYSYDKLKAFQDLLESTEDRLVVFYNFYDELDELVQIAAKCKRPFGVVNGKVKNPEMICTDSAILFVQYQAGAYGLNLQKANKVIYYSLPLGVGSCDLWEQSKKRIHRIGQDRTCFYYYLLVKNSIETWNLELLKKGKDLTNELFENHHNY